MSYSALNSASLSLSPEAKLPEALNLHMMPEIHQATPAQPTEQLRRVPRSAVKLSLMKAVRKRSNPIAQGLSTMIKPQVNHTTN